MAAKQATIVNLEEKNPTVQEAMNKLDIELMTLRRLKVKMVKVVHGYGSSGKGGSIRVATRNRLRELESSGKIQGFCMGEDFGPFEQAGRDLIAKEPAFRKDADWARSNDGITMVLL